MNPRIFPLILTCSLAPSACGGDDESPAVERVAHALSVPGLDEMSGSESVHAGTLCFTTAPDFHTNIGYEQPGAGGWVDIREPHSRAVLGGTGRDFSLQVAKTEVEFQIQSMDPAWNNDHFGPRRQVCAEMNVQDPCNLVRLCWVADGSWRVETKRNVGMDSLAECGENGVTLMGGPIPGLSPLSDDGEHTYKIAFSAYHYEDEEMDVAFYRDGVLQHAQGLYAPLYNPDGYAGIRTDRMTVRAKVSGQKDPCPGIGTCVLDTGVMVPATRVRLERAGLSCGYYDNFVPPAQRAPIEGTLPPGPITAFTGTFNWAPCRPYVDVVVNVPAEAVWVHLYRDGHQTEKLVPFFDGVSGLREDERVLPGASYSYQLVWEDAQGRRSRLSSTRVQTPPRCVSPLAADGQFKVAVKLFYYTDYNQPLPVTEAQATNAIFGGSSTGAPFSPSVFVKEMSRDRLSLVGDVYGWTPLQGTSAAQCAGGQCAFTPSLEAQARAAHAGFDPANYDWVMYFVHGPVRIRSAETPEWTSAHRLLNAATGSSTILHEHVGHALAQIGHNGGLSCSNNVPDIIVPGPDLGDATGSHPVLSPGIVCESDVYQDRFSSMGSGANGELGYFHTMALYNLGWLDDDETITDRLGGVYTIGRLASQTTTKQLRMHLYDNWFYFVEYRTYAGMDLQRENQMDTTYAEGVQVRLWQNTQSPLFRKIPMVSGGNYGGVSNGVLMTQRGLQPGQLFCDPHRQVSVQVQSSNAETATVQVQRGPCVPVAYQFGCGDGFVQAPEQCDDNNGFNAVHPIFGDGCAHCQITPGYTCSGQPSQCVRQ